MMTKIEFHVALQHLAHNPQDIIFFEDDLKEFALNMEQDLFFTKYWDVVRFISGCWDVAEQQGLFASTDCVYDDLQRERAL